VKAVNKIQFTNLVKDLPVFCQLYKVNDESFEQLLLHTCALAGIFLKAF